MRRTHLRGHVNILKRLLVHGGAFTLGVLMRKLFGRGTPRGLQGRRCTWVWDVAMLMSAVWGLADRVARVRGRIQRHHSAFMLAMPAC
jgi:hypothetical protein